MEDLYPKKDWNFVYGEADIDAGTGCYSFARLDPIFPNEDPQVPPSSDDSILILRRAVKVILHEIGHLFGLSHCIYFTCLMNGTTP